MLDVVSPEKIPGRVVPRVGVRDRAPGSTGGDGHTIGTDATVSSRREPGGTTSSAQNQGDCDPKLSKGTKRGGSCGTGGAGDGREGGPEKAGRGRTGSRRSGLGPGARKKKANRPERFFEVSATTQVKMRSPVLVQRLAPRQGRQLGKSKRLNCLLARSCRSDDDHLCCISVLRPRLFSRPSALFSAAHCRPVPAAIPR